MHVASELLIARILTGEQANVNNHARLEPDLLRACVQRDTPGIPHELSRKTRWKRDRRAEPGRSVALEPYVDVA